MGRRYDEDEGGHGILASIFDRIRSGYKPDLPDLIGTSGCYMTQHDCRYCHPSCNFYTKCSRGFYG